MLDRRTYPRTRVIFGGTIASQNARVDCVVRNISASGANIELPTLAAISDDFHMTIPRLGRTFLGKIIWCRANRAGIAFQTANTDEPATQVLDIEERVRISEHKARALKQRVRQLLSEG